MFKILVVIKRWFDNYLISDSNYWWLFGGKNIADRAAICELRYEFFLMLPVGISWGVPASGVTFVP